MPPKKVAAPKDTLKKKMAEEAKRQKEILEKEPEAQEESDGEEEYIPVVLNSRKHKQYKEDIEKTKQSQEQILKQFESAKESERILRELNEKYEKLSKQYDEYNTVISTIKERHEILNEKLSAKTTPMVIQAPAPQIQEKKITDYAKMGYLKF